MNWRTLTNGTLVSPYAPNLLAPSSFPSPKWEWVVFGDRNLIAVSLVHDVSWWRRTLTKIVLGSKWRKLS